MLPPRRERKAQVYTIPAPMGGWVLNQNVAASSPGGARHLENWFPTEDAVRVRKGAERVASVDGQIVSMFSYRSSSTVLLFAATASAIYDVTAPADPDTPEDPMLTDQTAGYWSVAYMPTAGGDYMVCVNGADTAQLFNGTDFLPHTDAAVSYLDYDALSSAFTKGETLTGGTSGATATIEGYRIDSATTGRLYISGISGTFQNDEAITDGATGAATADGTTASANTAWISGVATSDLSYVWVFKNRLFFVVKDSLVVRYLPVTQIGGAASDFTLRGVFTRGGSLLFGATWSSDSGDGMDDRCVFVSDLGEVAVFEGTDPSSADTWAIVGRYEIGEPLGPRCWMRAAGDLIIGTKEGAVPLSQVVTKNAAALSASAVTRPIEEDWREYAAARTSLNWEMGRSFKDNWAMITQPSATSGEEKRCYAVNLKTGAWALWTGWDALCLAEHAGDVYFGTTGGRVLKADTGALDDGQPYIARMATHFDHLGAYAAFKVLHAARATLRAVGAPTVQVSVSDDYNISFPSPPAATILGDGDLWGTGLWGAAVWYSPVKRTITSGWRDLGRSAEVVSLQVQMQMGGGSDPLVDLSSIDLSYSIGGYLV